MLNAREKDLSEQVVCAILLIPPEMSQFIRKLKYLDRDMFKKASGTHDVYV